MMSSIEGLADRWKSGPRQIVLHKLHACLTSLDAQPAEFADALRLLDDLPGSSGVASARDLRGASLVGGARCVNFERVDFSHADLQCNFVRCDLSGAIFDQAQGSDLAIGDKLEGASFIGSRLPGATFARSSARRCVFDHADLRYASFEAADLTGSSFKGAELTGVNMRGARLSSCDLRGAKLSGAVFLEVDLDTSTDLRGASLLDIWATDQADKNGNIVAAGTDWTQATLDSTTITGEGAGAHGLQVLLQAHRSLVGREGAMADRLRDALERELILLELGHSAEWWTDIVGQFLGSERPYVEDVLRRALENCA
jgi:uncharacterized protein YjbI with pentapeptide repeats